MFSCYASTSTIGSLPRIYRLVSGTETVEGDLDGNDEVTTADVEILVNMLLGKIAKTDAANLDGDEDVTIADLTKLINILLNYTE